MNAFRITLGQPYENNEGKVCLGYKSQLVTAQILAKNHVRKVNGENLAWADAACVRYLIGESLWEIRIEPIDIEF